MANRTPEEKLASIFQEVGLEKFKAMVKLIMALNTPRRERKKKEKAVAAA